MALTSLLVCDDARAVQVLSRVLVELGISVETCVDPEAALNLLAAEQFDALVIDFKSESAATNLAVNARHTPDNHGTLIVALLENQNRAPELFEKGINFVLYKPISSERASASLQAARELMQRERRRHPRVAIHAPASMDYAGIENVPATILDLSEDGIAIQCERKLPPRCKVYFQFTLPQHTSKVRLSGQVMWQDSSGRVGIRFAEVPQMSRRSLGDWLRKNAPSQKLTYEDLPAVVSDYHRPKDSPYLGSGSTKAGSERRNRARLSCRLSADVSQLGSDAPQHCHVSDISSNGCYLDTTIPLPVTTEVEILIRNRDAKVRVYGVVRETHPACGMGILFIMTSPVERARVQDLVDSLVNQESVV
jgi:CheY-like chemotaxis protein